MEKKNYIKSGVHILRSIVCWNQHFSTWKLGCRLYLDVVVVSAGVKNSGSVYSSPEAFTQLSFFHDVMVCDPGAMFVAV